MPYRMCLCYGSVSKIGPKWGSPGAWLPIDKEPSTHYYIGEYGKRPRVKYYEGAQAINRVFSLYNKHEHFKLSKYLLNPKSLNIKIRFESNLSYF